MNSVVATQFGWWAWNASLSRCVVEMGGFTGGVGSMCMCCRDEHTEIIDYFYWTALAGVQ